MTARQGESIATDAAVLRTNIAGGPMLRMKRIDHA
jgi:hypothetical protein